MARFAPRRLFDPVQGWFRRTERATSLFLSRSVFPWVPGARSLYDRTLASRLTVADAEIVVPGLPAGFDGTTVLLVTDLHAGPFLSVAGLRSAFARLGALAPDLVVLGGDFITTRVEEILPHADTLRSLRAPLGVFGVLGNHDHYGGDAPRLVEVVGSLGIRILDNDAALLERRGSRLAVAGIDDWNAGRPDLDRALLAAGDGPVVLISHNPDAFVEASRRGVALTLSGHTHGGQIRVPGLGVLVRMSRFRLDEGRYRADESEIVVSRGLGVSGIPVRLGCPPEAVLVRLRAA